MNADFTLDRFERVDASANTVLLRLSGRWTSVPGPEERKLVVRGREIAPLPDPWAAAPEPGELWRGAYPVHVALVEAVDATFALGHGSRLPAPVSPG